MDSAPRCAIRVHFYCFSVGGFGLSVQSGWAVHQPDPTEAQKLPGFVCRPRIRGDRNPRNVQEPRGSSGAVLESIAINILAQKSPRN